MDSKLNISLFCATDRGVQFLKKLKELLPSANLIVISFQEEPWEPKYLNKIRSLVRKFGGKFFLWDDIKDNDQEFWKNLYIDITFVVSWRYYISEEIYGKSKIGSYLFHDSLLPENRGFSPTIWSIIKGKNYTGVTLLEIGKKIDSGDIIYQTKIPFNKKDQISKILSLVTNQYLTILSDNLKNIINGKIIKTPQNDELATYNPRRSLTDNIIDWQLSANMIYNKIRALTKPYPGAFTYLNKNKLIIWNASIVRKSYENNNNEPGSLMEIIKNKGVVVKTGHGYLLLENFQTENCKPQNSSHVIKNLDLVLG